MCEEFINMKKHSFHKKTWVSSKFKITKIVIFVTFVIISGMIYRLFANNSDSLNVYVVAMPNYVEGEIEYWSSPFSLGEFFLLRSGIEEEGEFYLPKLNEFASEKGIEIKVTYFANADLLWEQLEYDYSNKSTPDLVLCSGFCETDLEELVSRDYFLCLNEFIDSTEMDNNDEYYLPILNAGQIEDEYIFLPIGFNLNVMMSSQSKNKMLNSSVIDSDKTWSEIVHEFIRLCDESPNGSEGISYLAFPVIREDDLLLAFPMQVLFQSTGLRFDEVFFEDSTFSKEVFTLLIEFYNHYYASEVESDKEVVNFSDSIHGQLCYEFPDLFNLHYNELGIIIEGSSGQSMISHSFLAMMNYYESWCSDNEEEFCYRFIPMISDNSSYAATISQYGAILKDSENPESAFELLKYIIDSDRFQYYNLSPNRNVSESMIEQMTELNYEIDPNWGSTDLYSEQKNIQYTMHPFQNETQNEVLRVLENVQYAQIPNWYYFSKFESVVYQYVQGYISLDEAYSIFIAERY